VCQKDSVQNLESHSPKKKKGGGEEIWGVDQGIWEGGKKNKKGNRRKEQKKLRKTIGEPPFDTIRRKTRRSPSVSSLGQLWESFSNNPRLGVFLHEPMYCGHSTKRKMVGGVGIYTRLWLTLLPPCQRPDSRKRHHRNRRKRQKEEKKIRN